MRTVSAPILGPGLFRDPTLWTAFSPEKLAPAVRPFLLALGITALAVGPARWIALRIGAVAHPGERRIHRRSTPLLGGLAMLVGFALTAWYFSGDSRTAGLLLTAAAITAIMVVDDLRGLSAPLKLACQVVVSLIAIVAFGFQITFISLPGGIWHLAWLAIPITLIWFVGLQNTVNLLDGVDGLAAGVVAIVAGAILLAAVNLQETQVVILSGALIGACAGFLLFNWHPARIFMGDAGSHFLGFTLAALSVIALAKVTVALALAVPIVALAIPIADTGWAILRRRLRGQSIATPDAEHLHHRMLDYGLSPRETALIFYFSTAIFAAFGLTIYGHRKVLVGAMLLMLAGIVIIVVRRSRRTGR